MGGDSSRARGTPRCLHAKARRATRIASANRRNCHDQLAALVRAIHASDIGPRAIRPNRGRQMTLNHQTIDELFETFCAMLANYARNAF
jgi:hypothetical protein